MIVLALVVVGVGAAWLFGGLFVKSFHKRK